MAGPVFSIVAEFVVHEGAYHGLNALTNKLEGVSMAAEGAMNKISRLGMHFAYTFSGVGGGIVGLIMKAVSASDKYTQSRLDFTKIIGANKDKLVGIREFNDELKMSDRILNKIIEDSRRWSLPVEEFAAMSKGVSSMLIPKGLAGPDSTVSVDIARNLLKSAPALMLNPWDVQTQLLRMIEGSSTMNDTLFRRLLTDAPSVFEKYGIKDSGTAIKKFKGLDIVKRVNLLGESLEFFSTNVAANTMRVRSFTGILRRLRGVFSGMSSILKPLGDFLLNFFGPSILRAISYLEVEGAKMVKTFVKILKKFLKTPEQFYVDMRQIMALGSSGGIASAVTMVTLFIGTLKETITFLGKFAFMRSFMASLGKLGSQIPILGVLGNWFKKFVGWMMELAGAKTLGLMVLKLGKVFILGFFFAQAFSRALAKLRIDFFKGLLDSFSRLVELADRSTTALKQLTSPMTAAIDGWSEIFYKMMKYMGFDEATSPIVSLAEGLIWLMGIIGTVVATLHGIADFLTASVLQSFLQAWEQMAQFFRLVKGGNFIDALRHILNLPWLILQVIQEGWDAGKKAFFNRYDPDAQVDDKGEVVENKIEQNIDKVEIKQSFKDKQEPDRIAFSIKEVLEKVANNPTQSKAGGGIGGITRGAIAR